MPLEFRARSTTSSCIWSRFLKQLLIKNFIYMVERNYALTGPRSNWQTTTYWRCRSWRHSGSLPNHSQPCPNSSSDMWSKHGQVLANFGLRCKDTMQELLQNWRRGHDDTSEYCGSIVSRAGLIGASCNHLIASFYKRAGHRSQWHSGFPPSRKHWHLLAWKSRNQLENGCEELNIVNIEYTWPIVWIYRH